MQMSSKLLPLLVVWLCFTGCIYAATNTFTVTGANLTAQANQQTILTITPSGFSGLVTITISASPSGVVVLGAPSHQFTSAAAWQVTVNVVDAPKAGKVTLSFILNNVAEYEVPSNFVFQVYNIITYPSHSLAPGDTQDGSLSLTGSPFTAVTITLSSTPSGLSYSPSSFSFLAGQAPYKLAYTVTSTQPGTYYVIPVLSGPDADSSLVSSPLPNVTVSVGKRTIYTNPTGVSYLKVGQTTKPYLVYVDISPDNSFTYNIYPIDPNVIASPSSLVFTPSTKSQTYTLKSNKEVSSGVVANATGPDAAKYIVAQTPSISYSNRTVNTPTAFNSLLVGVTSPAYSIYVPEAPDVANPLTLVISSPDNLVFNPSSLTFDTSRSIGTFTITASNTTATGARRVYYALSGNLASAFTVPAPASVAIAATVRTVHPQFSFNSSQVPFNESVNILLVLDNIPPSSFTVSLDGGPNVKIVPSVFTFTSSTGTLQQSLSLTFVTLGSSRVTFTIGGTDQALVKDIPSIAFTVVQYSAPEVSVGSAVVGIPIMGTLRLPNPVITSLDVTFITSPESSIVSPSSFHLVSPGLDAGSVEYSFTITAPSTVPFVLRTVLSGQDAPLFPAVDDILVTVSSVSFDTSSFVLPSPLTIGVPVTGITVFLHQAHPSVTLTPSSATLRFDPPSLSFGPEVSEICVTVTPLSLIASDTIVWTSSDSSNYNSPSPLPFGPIVKKTFDLGKLTGTVPLVVGVPSMAFSVRVNYPSSTGVTLTPASTDGLVLTPSSLSFTAGVDTLYFTITATSLGNRNPVVTWSVSGPDAASFSTPAIVNTVTVAGRSLSVSGSFETLVNEESTPLVITSDFLVDGLTITPTAPDLVFTPPSQSLTTSNSFVAFTARYPVWKENDGTANVGVQFVFSGARASWYNPLSTGFVAYKRNIKVSQTDIDQLFADKPGFAISFTLQQPATNEVSLSFCAPGVISITPPMITFAPGQTVATVIISAQTILGTLPLSSASIGIDVVGTDAVNYNEIGSITVHNIKSASSVLVSGFPSSLLVGNVPHVFEISIPFVNSAPFSIIPVSESGFLQFEPAEISFDQFNLHRFVSVASASIFHNKGSSSKETVTFQVVGSTSIYGNPSPQIVTINKRGITSSIPTTDFYAGTISNGYISLEVPPGTGSITITAAPSPNLIVVPSSLTFVNGNNRVYFAVSAANVGSYTLGWKIEGTEASLYDLPPAIALSVSSNIIELEKSQLLIEPGRQTISRLKLSSPVKRDLTITPIVPASLSVTPITLVLGPGDSIAQFSVKLNGPSLFTSDFTVLNFELSGSDAAWYYISNGPVIIKITTGATEISQVNPTEVGTVSQSVYFSLSVPTVNGLTVTPVSSSSSFSPSQLTFLPGSSRLSFKITPNTVGIISLGFSFSGPDELLYSVPQTITFESFARRIEYDNFQTPQQGVNYVTTVYLSSPPPTSVIVTPVAHGVVFSPTSLSFSPSSSSQQLISTPSSCGVIQVDWTVSGADAGWYDVLSYFPGSASYAVDCINFHFDISSNIRANVPVNGRVYIGSPASVSVVPSAPGCSFTPSTWSFDEDVISLPYSVICTAPVGVETTKGIPVVYTVSGSDAQLINQPVTSEDLKIYPNILNVPDNVETYSGKSVDLELHLDAPLALSVTVTPVASHITFSPSSFEFLSGTSAIITATPSSPTEPLAATISYLLSGPGAAYVGLLHDTTQLYSKYGTLASGFAGGTIGEQLGPKVLVVTPAPNTDVTFTPSAPGCEFAPPSASFSSFSTVVSVAYTCYSVGSTRIQYTISGTDQAHYAVPDSQQLDIEARIIEIGFPNTAIQIFDDNFGNVLLLKITDSGLTITPHSAVLTFTPPSFTLFAGSNLVAFKYTASKLGNDLVWFELGGVDASLYYTPDPVNIAVSARNIIPYFPASGTVYAGSSSNTFSVVLDRAPTTGLTVRPYGSGASFTPETLQFQPGQTALSFNAKVFAAGYFQVDYDVSGPDSEYYAAPGPSNIETASLSLEILTTNIGTSYVGVPTPPLLISANRPPSANIRIDFVGSGFTPATIILTPSVTSATFTYTPSSVGFQVLAAKLSGAALGDFEQSVVTAAKFYSNPRIIRVPNNLPDLFAGVPSTSISVGLDYSPPTDLTITPTAPNVVFTPSSLIYSPSDSHKEFKFTSSQATQFNDAPDSKNAPSRVSWTLSGTNAGWYAKPNFQTINVVPRDLNVYFYQEQQLNIWFDISVVTSYPSSSALTFTFVGNFRFNPATVTLSPNNTSISVKALPLSDGDIYFRVLVSGAEVSSYQILSDYKVKSSKWYFSTPNLQTAFQIGQWSSPFIVRPSHVPTDIVTLSITSDYLESFPATLSFNSSSPSASFSLRLRKGLDYLRLPVPQKFVVHYWVGGPAAWLFGTPSASTLTWELSFPPRALTVNNFPAELVVGVPSPPVTVVIPNFPFDTLTITPVAYSHHVRFNPPSLQLNRTSFSYLSSFTITVDHPNVVGVVEFLLTGLDAIYYSPPALTIYSVSPRDINFATSTLTVGRESKPFSAYLEYPIPNGLSVILSSPHASFNPSTLSFAPNVSAVAFTVTPYTVGDYVPVTVSTVGADVDWFYPAAVTFPSALFVSAREWYTVPVTTSIRAGQPFIFEYGVKIAPGTDLTITPYGSCITFTPPSATFTARNASISFTAIGLVPGVTCQVSTVVTGTAAAWYPAISVYTISVTSLTISVPTLKSDISIDLGERRDLLIKVDSPVNGINISFVANGLTFSPPSCYIPPGHSYCHASYISTAPGLSVVSLVVDGIDSLLYSVNQINGVIRVQQHLLKTTSPSSLLVGSQSGAFVLLSVGGSSNNQRAPLAPVTVNFLVSPPGAATVSPSTVQLTSEISAVQTQVTANIPADMIYITPVLSGPGASFYASDPGVSPAPFSFASTRRSFSVTDPFNSLALTNQRQLFVGEISHKFGVTCNGVPSDDVVLYLSAPGLEFIPSALRFTGTFETIYFNIKPTKPIVTQITFSVGGANANLYSVPSASGPIRVTHKFSIPALETVNVGVISDLHTISITSPLSSTVYLTPTTSKCTVSPSSTAPNLVTFFPPYLIFTPNSTTQTFSYIGNCASNNLGNNFNPVITAVEGTTRYSNAPVTVPITWQVTEAGESSSYSLSFPLDRAVLAVAVTQVPFNIQFDSLAIGSASKVVISVVVPPRSDVILTLIGNNINFNPPHAVFVPGVTSVTLQISLVHRDFKDSQSIPFTVDYIVSGTNWRDYIPPAQSFLGAGRGNGDIAGGILGNGAGVVSVSIWVVALAALVIMF